MGKWGNWTNICFSLCFVIGLFEFYDCTSTLSSNYVYRHTERDTETPLQGYTTVALMNSTKNTTPLP